MKHTYALKQLKTDLEIKIEKSPSLVGRSSNCDLQVDKETLSREHARLVIKGDQLLVEDLHSTNGTFVNEQQIFEAQCLRPGDLVRFGQESFSVISSAADATQMFDRQAMQNMGSSMLVEDEEEEDGTVMLQAISLPVGWEKAAVPTSTKLSEEDASLVNALKQHAIKKLKHPHGMLLSIIEDGRAPVVKLLSTENTEADWSIGRSIDCPIRLTDGRISEKHLRIAFNQGNWLAEDLGSRNGSYVRDEKITKVALSSSSEIAIGPYTILLEVI